MYCIRCKRYDYEIGESIHERQTWEAIKNDGSTAVITIPYDGNFNQFQRDPSIMSIIGLCPECLLSPEQVENVYRRR